jgi:hypothetical protein
MITTMITTTLTLIGIATYYPIDDFEGRPLYCNYTDPTLIYTHTLEPWIALDVSYYLFGQVKCGDEFVLTFEDGYALTARAWDAGYLSGHSVSTWPDEELVVDIPEYYKPFVRRHLWSGHCATGERGVAAEVGVVSALTKSQDASIMGIQPRAWCAVAGVLWRASQELTNTFSRRLIR